MKKSIIIVGLIILVIGGLLMFVGSSMSSSAYDKVNECNTTAGKLKQLVDTDYASECDSAAGTFNLGSYIYFSGIPMLIVGIFILIAGVIMKGPA